MSKLEEKFMQIDSLLKTLHTIQKGQVRVRFAPS